MAGHDSIVPLGEDRLLNLAITGRVIAEKIDIDRFPVFPDLQRDAGASAEEGAILLEKS
jgi:hypothetical protein